MQCRFCKTSNRLLWLFHFLFYVFQNALGEVFECICFIEESNTSSNAPEKTSQTANDLPQDQDGELNGADAVSLSKLSLILFDEVRL